MKNTKKPYTQMMCEISIRYRRPIFEKMPHIKSSEDANDILRKSIDNEGLSHKEYFWILLLNQSNRVLGFAEIGRGDTSGVALNLKEIFQMVILSNSSGLIVAHNHPSGNTSPSEQDRVMMKKIKHIAELFSITLIDSLILTTESYFSFSDNHQL